MTNALAWLHVAGVAIPKGLSQIPGALGHCCAATSALECGNDACRSCTLTLLSSCMLTHRAMRIGPHGSDNST